MVPPPGLELGTRQWIQGLDGVPGHLWATLICFNSFHIGSI